MPAYWSTGIETRPRGEISTEKLGCRSDPALGIDRGRITSHSEVAGTSADQYRPNALVLIEFGREFCWMVGNPEKNADTALSE